MAEHSSVTAGPVATAVPALAPIEQTPLKVQIADQLRRAIVTGRLRPGAVLVETALAEQLNVSRAPIREAVQILETDGLVETAAYKGKRVKPLTIREVVETCEMRTVFEVTAVRRILAQDALRHHQQVLGAGGAALPARRPSPTQSSGHQ